MQVHAAGDVKLARSLLAKSTKAAGMLKGIERAEALAAIADVEAELGNEKQAAHVRELLARAVAALKPDPPADPRRVPAARSDSSDGRGTA